MIALGQQDVGRWQEAIETSAARGYFAAGRTGPANRPNVNLTQARWQDAYAATRLAREPAPLAGIAFASAEAGAVTMLLSRLADPLLATGSKIDNPALAAAGGLDLVTVLTLLVPLLILALGLEVGGYERATGVLPLVRVQSGHDRAWIWARCLAVGLIAATAGLVLSGIACVAAGAGLADALPLVLLVLAYVAVWTALLGTVALVSRNPSHGAVVLGAAWIVLCVLIPSIAVERSAAIAADDFALDLTVEARDAGTAVAALDDDALYSGLYARFPALEGQAPQAQARRAATRRVALQGMRIVGLEERMAQREMLDEAHVDLVARTSLLSPAVGFTHALEQLAGRGPEAAQAFREAVAATTAERMELFIAASWRGARLDADDFERLVATTPGSVAPPPSNWWRELLILGGWTLGLVGTGPKCTPVPGYDQRMRDSSLVHFVRVCARVTRPTSSSDSRRSSRRRAQKQTVSLPVSRHMRRTRAQARSAWGASSSSACR
ncbi:MAG: DUF3526 domain-containing protein [Planctomycetota bacterium]